MYISLGSNLINLVGNCIGIYILHARVAQSIWSMAALMGVAMSPVFITVIGQCMGAGKS